MSWCNPAIRTPWCADPSCAACAPHRPQFAAPPSLLRGNRVECTRCRAHRDIRLAPTCLVCGAGSYELVRPTPGDVDTAIAAVIAAAEDLDVALHAGAVVTTAHRCATRLARACRDLALSKAGQRWQA